MRIFFLFGLTSINSCAIPKAELILGRTFKEAKFFVSQLINLNLQPWGFDVNWIMS